MKPVNLSVHRNNKAQRERKARRGDFREDARECLRKVQIDGYVIVAWDEEGTARAWWSSKRVPGSLVGAMAKQVVERTINGMDTDERLGIW